MKQEPGRQQPGISGLQAGEDVNGLRKGRSYYGGDGLNKSLVSVDAFLDAVRSVRAED